MRRDVAGWVGHSRLEDDGQAEGGFEEMFGGGEAGRSGFRIGEPRNLEDEGFGRLLGADTAPTMSARFAKGAGKAKNSGNLRGYSLLVARQAG